MALGLREANQFFPFFEGVFKVDLFHQIEQLPTSTPSSINNFHTVNKLPYSSQAQNIVGVHQVQNG